MNILVMGAGGVGGCFGGMLARSGQSVTFVARGPHLEAIRRNGLRVRGDAVGEFTVDAPVLERPDGTEKADLVLFCVKSYQNDDALRIIAPVVGSSTAILTLQNGIGAGDQIAGRFGVNAVLLGAAYIEAAREAPGVVSQAGGPPRIVFGEPSGGHSDRAARVRDVLKGAGVDAVLSQDIHVDLWQKLAFICALSGMTCVTRSSFAEVMDDPGTMALVRRVVSEVEAVARARGVGLDGGVIESTMRDMQAHKDDLISSMHLDLQAGRPLELDSINGAVSRMGHEAGVETPLNDFITTCLGLADRRARASG